MFVDIKIRNSQQAKELLNEIDAKHKELDELCRQLSSCLRVDAEIICSNDAVVMSTEDCPKYRHLR